MSESFKILVVDDEPAYCEALSLALKSEGYDVTESTDPRQAVELVKTDNFDLVISDLIMPEMNGVELLKKVKDVKPETYIIILTAFGTIENAVEAMKYGAFNYVIKGSDIEQLLGEIEIIKKISQSSVLPDPAGETKEYTLKSNNKKYRQVLNLAEKAAKSDSNVLILGESGVGKEVIAQYIYRESKRNQNKFIATNCHTYSSNLLESELFGHEKGAFTGALQKRVGLFETSEEGTLFLDEIGDIPLETQAKLLRTIETKKITRIGSNDEIKVDFRLITATNKNLEEEMAEGRFREDLFFRISTIVLNLPPLRQRKEDLPHLIEFFIKRTCESLGMDEIKFPDSTIQKMLQYDYPGNIRELKNIVERLIVLSDKGVVNEDILSEMFSDIPVGNINDMPTRQLSLKELRQEIESRYIEEVLDANDSDAGKAAEILGISKRHLFNKMAEYGLNSSEHSTDNEGD